MKKISGIIPFLVVLAASFILPASSFGAQEFFTVQTGSYRSVAAAEKNFIDLEQILPEESLDFLRIEKVQGFQTLRIGKFAEKAAAFKLLEMVRNKYPASRVLSAFVKPERILKMHGAQAESPAVPPPVAPESVEQDGRSVADQEYYTLQLGSFRTKSRAEKGYADFARKLAGQDLDFLRIEKIKNIYTLRLGRFAGRAAAGRLIEANPDLAGAVILQAYIKEERIVRMHGDPSKAAAVKAPDVPAEAVQPGKAVSVPEPAGPAVAGQPEPVGQDGRSVADQEYYTLQLGSFRAEFRAEKGYADLARKLAGLDLDYLRIEKIKKIYTLRLGRFTSRAAAGRLIGANPDLAGAVILQVYIKEERIVRMYAPALEGEKAAVAPTEPLPEPPPAVKEIAADVVEPLEPAPVAEEESAAPEFGPLVAVEAQKEVMPRFPESAPVPAEPVPAAEEESAAPESRPLVAAEAQEEEAAQDDRDLLAGPLIERAGAAGPEEASADEPGQDLQPVVGGAGAESSVVISEDIEGLESLEGVIFADDYNTPKGLVPARVVTILNLDEQGEPFGFPGRVVYDQAMEELYLLIGKGSGSILVIGPDYFPYSSLGQGRGVDAPRTVLITDDGRLLVGQGVSDKHQPRLTLLNAAFFLDREIDLDTIPEGKGLVPEQIAMGTDGSIFMVGLNRPGVAIFDRRGNFKHWWRPIDNEFTNNTAEGFPPGTIEFRDVVVDQKGRIYLLSEKNSKIYVFSSKLEFIYSFGKKGGSSGKMSRPRGLALDELRKCVYVVDYMRHTILVFNMEGEFIFEFGGYGNGPGWFQYPVDVEVGRNGHVIVSDLFNHRIQVLEIR